MSSISKRESDIELSKDQVRALEKVKKSRRIFVTGQAGTGKSALLHKIREELDCVVLAPTGVAALNVGGVTIHSFFRFPLGLLSESNIEINPIRSKLKKVKAIVIDEVSMVRADIMDAIDLSLRWSRNPKKAFGGVKMVFIGDLHQLSPIVKRDEKQAFEERYDSPYFFSAKVFEKAKLRRAILTTNHAYPVDAEGRFGGMVLWAADIPDDPVRYKNSSLMRQLAPNISRVSNG